MLLIELYKLFKQRQVYYTFLGAVLLVVILIIVAKSGANLEFQLQTGSTIDLRPLINAYFVMGFTLTIGMPFLLPLFVTLNTSNIFTREFTEGTIKTYLVRIGGRKRIFIAKVIVNVIITFLLLLFTGIVSFSLGALFFGTETKTFISPLLPIPIPFSWEDNFLPAYLYSCICLITIASLSVFWSVTSNSTGETLLKTLSTVILLNVLSNIQRIKPILFTSYLDIWSKAWSDPIPWTELNRASLILGLYSLGFVVLGYLIFSRKDILC